jgi:flagellar hook-associated protein FlgK
MNLTLSTAVSGLQSAQNRLAASAHRVASSQTADAAGSGVSLEQEVVAQLEAKHGFQASLQVVKTADRMLGSLLDIRA